MKFQYNRTPGTNPSSTRRTGISTSDSDSSSSDVTSENVNRLNRLSLLNQARHEVASIVGGDGSLDTKPLLKSAGTFKKIFLYGVKNMGNSRLKEEYRFRGDHKKFFKFLIKEGLRMPVLSKNLMKHLKRNGVGGNFVTTGGNNDDSTIDPLGT